MALLGDSLFQKSWWLQTWQNHEELCRRRSSHRAFKADPSYELEMR